MPIVKASLTQDVNQRFQVCFFFFLTRNSESVWCFPTHSFPKSSALSSVSARVFPGTAQWNMSHCRNQRWGEVGSWLINGTVVDTGVQGLLCLESWLENSSHEVGRHLYSQEPLAILYIFAFHFLTTFLERGF